MKSFFARTPGNEPNGAGPARASSDLLRAAGRPSSLFADSRSGGGLVSKRQRRQRALMRGGSSPCFSSPLPCLFFFSFMVALGCRVQRHRVASAEAEGRSGGGGRRREGRAVCKPVAAATIRKRRSEVHRVPHFGVLSGGRECGRRNARDAALWSPARQFWACVAGTGLRRLAEYRSRKPER